MDTIRDYWLHCLVALIMVVTIAAFVWTVLDARYTGPDAGYVSGHRYDDPDDWYVSGSTISGSCTGIGAERRCSPDTYIPGHYEHDGPHWQIKICDTDGKSCDWFGVDEWTYHEVRDGQWFNTKTGEVEQR